MDLKEKNGFTYVDEGEGEVLLLLHGLFGAFVDTCNLCVY